MKLIHIYECFCDEFRLRILNLLLRGPLCVCHIQAALGEDQVKTSKQLKFMLQRGLVEKHRYQNWNIYALPAKRSAELNRNLACLQDCLSTNKAFRDDLRELERLSIDTQLSAEIATIEQAAGCCSPTTKRKSHVK